jgi:hypothetical protein
MGLLAWRLYEADGLSMRFCAPLRQRSLSPSQSSALSCLAELFVSKSRGARVLRDSGRAQAEAAAVGYQEPSLVFLAGTETRLTDCRRGRVPARRRMPIAFIEQRQEKNFAQRAEAIGLRHIRGPRIEAMNISTGQTMPSRSIARGRVMTASDGVKPSADARLRLSRPEYAGQRSRLFQAVRSIATAWVCPSAPWRLGAGTSLLRRVVTTMMMVDAASIDAVGRFRCG